MRQTESLQVAIHAAKGTKSDDGSWEIREYDVIVGCFLSLRQEKRRYALSGKNGKACKRTRVIPYVRIRHAICRAAANGCVCGKLNRST